MPIPSQSSAPLIVGLKLTHDASIAVLEDWRLVSCVELEKLPNGKRHAGVKDLAVLFDVLRKQGIGPRDIGVLAIDGWRKTLRRPLLFGQEIEFEIAPYIGHAHDEGLLSAKCGTIDDLPYESYPHLTGHVMSAYCSSPAGHERRAALVLVWDGAMFPTAVLVDPTAASTQVVARLLPLLGDAYHEFARRYWPFQSGYEWPKTLTLAGKLMAYVARGEVVPRLVERWGAALRHVQEPPVWHEHYGRPILDRFLEACHGIAAGHLEHDIMASWHAFLERALLERLTQLKETLGARSTESLVLAGGCALNIKWNAAIRRGGLFREVFVPPFPNDSGNAIGAAIAARVARSGFDRLEWDVHSGPAIERGDVGSVPGWSVRDATLPHIVDLILGGEIVCALHGRAELGPRALGNRSLLASPKIPGIKRRLNLIKQREDYRPVSPICLEERAAEFFDPGCPEPFMLFDHVIRAPYRELLVNVEHEDGTTRLQTVSAISNPRIHALLDVLATRGEPPVICNTSANEAGGGFFTSVEECMRWGKVRYIWSEHELFTRVSN